MVQDSLFIQACRGVRRERAPVWFMRQAGRYLPEYQEIRKRHSMLDTIRNPELAAEVTLQPIRRFGFDAAIIFADILNPLIGMGLDLTFVEKTGPVITNPLRSAHDVYQLKQPDPAENTGYTARAIQMVAEQLNPKGIPVIGFSGAPFTLSAYAIEGGSVGDLLRVKDFIAHQPEAWAALQQKLVHLIVEYLEQQVRAGASAVQIFDSWLGALSPHQYKIAVEPYLQSLCTQLKSRIDVPVIFFSTGTYPLYPELSALDIDVLGVDWRVPLGRAQNSLTRRLPLQGNLDPVALITGGELLDQEIRQVLNEGRGSPAHIFNLGHGILPPTPIALVERALQIIRGEV